jgi:hypothetical protein
VNYYDFLGVRSDSHPVEIDAAYRMLSNQSHLDQASSITLNAVHQTLMNPTKRYEYDLRLQSGNGQVPFLTFDQPEATLCVQHRRPTVQMDTTRLNQSMPAMNPAMVAGTQYQPPQTATNVAAKCLIWFFVAYAIFFCLTNFVAFCAIVFG